jgi:argininosuccinate lyase
VFATDAALALVAEGMPFRDAYHQNKANLDDLENENPDEAIARKTHLGTTAGLDFEFYVKEIDQINQFTQKESEIFTNKTKNLLGL